MNGSFKQEANLDSYTVPDSFLRGHVSTGIEAVSGRIWVCVETQLTPHL